MVRIYGIRNCDTMKKARLWLDEHRVAYEFHDYKHAGLDRAVLRTWVAELGWEALLNRRGTTWRKLAEERRARIDEAGAIELMLEMPSIIRRPVLDLGDRRLVGFDEAQYAAQLGV
jgi:arsenate reductase